MTKGVNNLQDKTIPNWYYLVLIFVKITYQMFKIHNYNGRVKQATSVIDR